MKSILKSFLKTIGIYFPLQQSYDRLRSGIRQKKIKKQFESQRGDGLQCNVCNASYKAFAPRLAAQEDLHAIERNKVIAGYGQNIYCPNCMSTARERLVIAMLNKMDLKGKKVLHVSPEEKVYQHLRGLASVVTADLEPGFYRNIDRNMIRADLTRLSFENDFFDIVVGNHILEHIPDDRRAMSEVYRVLKPGGTAILQVPFSLINTGTIEDPLIRDSARQSELFGQKDHVRIYELYDYLDRLKRIGFNVEYSSYESLSELHAFGIQPHEGFIHIMK